MGKTSTKKAEIAEPPPQPLSQHALEILFLKALALFIICIVVYIPAFKGQYIYDDDQLLYMNPVIQRGHGFFDPQSWDGLKTIWLPLNKTDSADYFPLTSTTLWLEWRLWGNNDPKLTPKQDLGIGPTGYHVTNIILHAICALLLWAVLARMNIPGAWVAALLWGVHPVCAESVAWISERKNTLSMLLFLWMMLAWVRFQATRHGKDYAITILLFILALLAKTAIVMVPFVFLLHVWWKRSKLTMNDIIESVPFFALSFVFGLITMKLQYSRAIGDEHIPMGSWPERIGGASFSLGFYLYKVFLPLHLTLIYPQYHKTLPHQGLLWLEMIPALLYVGMFVWAWMKRDTWGKHVIFALGFFVVMLAPILGLMKIAYLRLTLVADHFQYTAMVSVIALVAAWFTSIRSRLERGFQSALIVLMAGFTVVFSLITWHRAGVIGDPETLWRDNIAEYPDSWQAHSHLGAILYGRGDVDEALLEWTQCVNLVPYLYEVHNNRGLALAAKGRMDEALKEYSTAVGIQSDQPMVKMNYADALRVMKHYDESIKQYNDLTTLMPGDPRVYLNMGVDYFMLDQLDKAADCFKKALLIAPNYGDAKRNLEATKQRRLMEIENPGAALPPPTSQAGH